MYGTDSTFFASFLCRASGKRWRQAWYLVASPRLAAADRATALVSRTHATMESLQNLVVSAPLLELDDPAKSLNSSTTSGTTALCASMWTHVAWLISHHLASDLRNDPPVVSTGVHTDEKKRNAGSDAGDVTQPRRV